VNRIELPQPVFCFAFLGEVDPMACGVHGAHDVVPALSGVLLPPQVRLQFNALDTKMDTIEACST
jgi:hypothetical protein